MSLFNREDLKEIVHDKKKNGLVVALCHGCFDILHVGHVRHLAAARNNSDTLFVSITGDKYVNKGPDRPIIEEGERAEMVCNLKSVSGAIINQNPTSVELLKIIQPSIYFKGQEYLNSSEVNFLNEKKTAIGLGIEVRYTFKKVCSSSKIISMLKKPSTQEVIDKYPEINPN